MSNRYILEQLINNINNYAHTQQNRSDFAIVFIDAIESLEDIPFSVIDKARDWQYRIETDNTVDQDLNAKQTSQLLKNLDLWVKELLRLYG